MEQHVEYTLPVIQKYPSFVFQPIQEIRLGFVEYPIIGISFTNGNLVPTASNLYEVQLLEKFGLMALSLVLSGEGVQTLLEFAWLLSTDTIDVACTWFSRMVFVTEIALPQKSIKVGMLAARPKWRMGLLLWDSPTWDG
mgnify:CR=1 FL=1